MIRHLKLASRRLALGGRRIRLALRRTRVVVYLLFQTLLILVGAVVTATGGNLGVAVGAAIVATGASGIIAFGWVLYAEAEVERRKVINDFGFVTAFPYRSIQIKHEYTERIATAHRNIDVMGFGLNAFREDLAGQFREWSTRAAIRVLLVDPDAPTTRSRFVDLRDIEEQNDPGRTRDEVKRFVEDTRALWSDPQINFHVRLAGSLPSINMFRIDDETFWGPYLISSSFFGHASRNLPTMIVRAPGYMHERLVDHFEQIWNSLDLSRAPE